MSRVWWVGGWICNVRGREGTLWALHCMSKVRCFSADISPVFTVVRLSSTHPMMEFKYMYLNHNHYMKWSSAHPANAEKPLSTNIKPLMIWMYMGLPSVLISKSNIMSGKNFVGGHAERITPNTLFGSVSVRRFADISIHCRF